MRDRDLLGAHVLGALDDDEAALVARAARDDPVIGRELRSLSAVVARLDALLAAEAPRAGDELWRRIEDAVARPDGPRGGRRRFARRHVWPSARTHHE